MIISSSATLRERKPACSRQSAAIWRTAITAECGTAQAARRRAAASTARLRRCNSHYGLGYADGADGVVSGLASGQIEVEYTLYGDANLDGVVNGTDFGILAANFGQQVTVGTRATSTTTAWSTAATSAHWRPTSASRPTAPPCNYPPAIGSRWMPSPPPTACMADVPEPSTVGMVFFAATAVVGRRRKRG